MRTSVLNGLGQALRWLRERHGRKQYQVADAAGITKGMLSSYETGRQRPSLETLEKVLSTLGCDLHDLHNSLQIVNGRPQILRRRFEGGVEEADGMDGNAEGTSPTGAPPVGRMDVQKILGLTQPLPAEEEKAVAQILDGFHRLIRYLHRTARPASSVTPTAPPLPSSPEGRDERGGRDGNDDNDDNDED